MLIGHSITAIYNHQMSPWSTDHNRTLLASVGLDGIYLCDSLFPTLCFLSTKTNDLTSLWVKPINILNMGLILWSTNFLCKLQVDIWWGNSVICSCPYVGNIIRSAGNFSCSIATPVYPCPPPPSPPRHLRLPCLRAPHWLDQLLTATWATHPDPGHTHYRNGGH